MSQFAKGIFQSIAVCYQATVERITKFISVFAEYQQYVELSEQAYLMKNNMLQVCGLHTKCWWSNTPALGQCYLKFKIIWPVHGGIPGRIRLD
jgi:hypothetical protein